MAERRIAVFTGSRSEYGLLSHLIAAIAAEPEMALQLIVSGSHLSEHHGSTLAEIEAEGYRPAALVPLSLNESPQRSMVALAAEALAGVGKALEILKPDLLILLGDRYETFAAASAAHLNTIPIVHLHGGETTKGAVDDRLRHAISQLSTWHFTAAEPYRERVIAMGHPPELVFNVGPMVLDNLMNEKPASRSEFEKRTGYRFGHKNLLVTYHPETLLPDHGVAGFEALLQALEGLTCHVLFTHPNADAGNDQLLALLKRFVYHHPESSWAVPSLGQKLYLTALRLFDAMAGNSSSGLIEAPFLGIPVINIGDRQAGRLRHVCVRDVASQKHAIAVGLEQQLEARRSVCRATNALMPCETPTKAILSWLREGPGV